MKLSSIRIIEYYRRRMEMILFAVLRNSYRIKVMRRRGVKIGKNCHIANISYSTEPYLIEIGDHVSIASKSRIITHDGSMWIFREEFPQIDLFGKIKIGNNVFIGIGCTILPNTTIGDNCVIGAGTVVRGTIPDNSIVMGNPGKVIMNKNIFKRMVLNKPGLFNTLDYSLHQKKAFLMEHFSEF